MYFKREMRGILIFYKRKYLHISIMIKNVTQRIKLKSSIFFKREVF